MNMFSLLSIENSKVFLIDLVSNLNLFFSLFAISSVVKRALTLKKKISHTDIEFEAFPVVSIGLIVYSLLFYFMRGLNGETYSATIYFNILALIFNLVYLYFLFSELEFGRSSFISALRRVDFIIVMVILSVFIFFIYVGAYHEYPSDPIQHLKFISDCIFADHLKDIPIQSFNYFLISLFIKKIDFVTRYYNMNIYSALFQTTMFYLTYRLTFNLTSSRIVSMSSAILSLCYFGTNIFSFYRYYVFAKSFFVYIVYLEAITVLIELLKKRSSFLNMTIALLVVYSFLNHKQEAILILIQVIFTPIMIYLLTNKKKLFRVSNRFLSFLVLISIGLLVAYKYLPKFPFGHEPQFLFFLEPIFPFLPSSQYWATVNFFPQSPFFKTFGLFGLLMLLPIPFSLIFRKKLPDYCCIITSITLVPILILFCPIAVYFLSRLMGDYLLYRFIYGSLYWVTFPVIMHTLVFKCSLPLALPLKQFFEKSRAAIFITIILVVVLASFNYRPPYWGKSYMLSYRPESHQDGKIFKPLISFIRENNLSNKRFASDGYTEVFLEMHEINTMSGERFYTNLAISAVGIYEDRKKLASDLKAQGYYGIIINKQKDESITGLISGHWLPKETASYSKFATRFMSVVLQKKYFEEVAINRMFSLFVIKEKKAIGKSKE